jgi:PAS domain S-box-containing protein
MHPITSIRTKTLLSILVPLIFVILFVALAGNYLYGYESQAAVSQRDTELARVSAERLSEGLARYTLPLQRISVEDGVRSMEPGQLHRALETAQSEGQLSTFDNGIAVYDLRGSGVLSIPSSAVTAGDAFPDTALWNQISRTLRPGYSDIFTDPATGNDIILVGVPVIGSDGELKGVLVGKASVQYSSLGPMFVDILELRAGGRGYAYLVDGRGHLIYHRYGNTYRDDLGMTEPITRVLAGENGAVLTQDPTTGESIISAFAPVPGTSWGVVTHEEWDTIFDPLRYINTLIIVLILGGGVVTSVLIFIQVNRILRPLRDLTAASRRIERGDFTPITVPQSGDEIQTLAVQFNTMGANLEKQILERTKFEEALSESEVRYRQIFESSPVSLWEEDFSEGKKYLDDLRASGVSDFPAYFRDHPEAVRHCAGLVRIIDVNKATLDLLGACDKGELQAGLSRIFIQESFDLFGEELAVLAEGGLQFEGVAVHTTLAGDRISAILHLVVAPGYEVTLGRVLISLLNITDQVKTQEALKKSEEKYRNIVSNMQDVFYRTDLSGKLIMASPSCAALLGYGSMEECLGWDIARAFYLDPAERQKVLNVLKNKGIVSNFEAVLKKKDGTPLYVLTNSHLYYDENGAVAGVEGIFRDITERKHAEEEIIKKNAELRDAYEQQSITKEELRQNFLELQKSQQALAQARKKLNLLNNVTFDDLRNAQFSLQGYLELQNKLPLDEKSRAYLQKEQEIAQKILNTLEFAQNYQDMGIKPPVWQNVTHVFLLAISHLDLAEITRDIRLDNLELYADPLLEKVFGNMVENVLKHGKGATKISLYSQVNANGLTLIFEDDGAGIPDTDKEMIFGRGYGRQKGMGLFLAREILGITSISIVETGIHGQGSRFELHVPNGAYRSAKRFSRPS